MSLELGLLGLDDLGIGDLSRADRSDVKDPDRLEDDAAPVWRLGVLTGVVRALVTGVAPAARPGTTG